MSTFNENKSSVGEPDRKRPTDPILILRLALPIFGTYCSISLEESGVPRISIAILAGKIAATLWATSAMEIEFVTADIIWSTGLTFE